MKNSSHITVMIDMKEIIGLHKGMIWVESPADENMNNGSIFHFQIPIN